MSYDVIVIGAGMMGAAAARHLAAEGAKVLLLGPEEPEAKAAHQGAFASHYDSGRITRGLDENADWARLARRSIDRYPDIASRSGIPFFMETGCLMAGPAEGELADFVARTEAVARRLDTPFERLEGAELADRFPFLAFPAGTIALHEASAAGCIDPRGLVRAQIRISELDGAAIVRAEAVSLEETPTAVRILCSDGETRSAPTVVVAAGAFSPGLLPNPPQLTVYARTVALLEVDEEEAERLRPMPSIIHRPADRACDPYILPPLRYPDRRLRLKIGGDPQDRTLATDPEIKDWFRCGGNPKVRDFLADYLMKLMPDLKVREVTMDACVTSFSTTGLPLIHRRSDRIVALTAGNGAAAKSSDEIGRLGAQVALGRSLDGEGYDGPFAD